MLSVDIHRLLPGDARLSRAIYSFVLHLNNRQHTCNYACHYSDWAIRLPIYTHVYYLHISVPNVTFQTTAIKLKAKQNVRTSTILFYILRRYYLHNSAHFSKIYCHTWFWDLTVHGASVAFAPELKASAILLSLHKIMKYGVRVFDGMKLIPISTLTTKNSRKVCLLIC